MSSRKNERTEIINAMKVATEGYLFERDIIQQRTKAGLEISHKRGKVGGRPAIDEKTL